MNEPQTPYYLIDEEALGKNLEVAKELKERSGCKMVLALKCFCTPVSFPQLAEVLDGTTSSSLNELTLGHEFFPEDSEHHAYSVAYNEADIKAAVKIADKVIFNSLLQLKLHRRHLKGVVNIGIRINPGISRSGHYLADPNAVFSRLGECQIDELKAFLGYKKSPVNGFMFHYNCETADYASLKADLKAVEQMVADLAASSSRKIEWISLGGGISFTYPEFRLKNFAKLLKKMAKRLDVQIYLEPGAALFKNAGTLEVSVLDKHINGMGIHTLIVDASTEAHALDLLTYDEHPAIRVHQAHSGVGTDDFVPQSVRVAAEKGISLSKPNGLLAHSQISEIVQVAGNTCLAGDSFGFYPLEWSAVNVGSRLSIEDMAAYTMVKKNWFNGVNMPAIAVRRKDGSIETVRTFGYDDFKSALI